MMSAKLNRIVAVWAAPVLAGAIVGLVGGRYLPGYLPESFAQEAKHQAVVGPQIRFSTINVTLPPGATTFPPGPGSDIANTQCVICHSTGMVLRQPPLAVEEWKTEILKMRNAFGAPIPLDQVDALAKYLGTIDGRRSGTQPSGVDSEAN
jgi:hypothetical protein